MPAPPQLHFDQKRNTPYPLLISNKPRAASPDANNKIEERLSAKVRRKA